MIRQLVYLLKDAAERRRSVLIVGKDLPYLSARFENGATIHCRSHAVGGLKSVAVDTVCFVGETPEHAKAFASERVRTSRYPQIMEIPCLTSHANDAPPLTQSSKG